MLHRSLVALLLLSPIACAPLVSRRKRSFEPPPVARAVAPAPKPVAVAVRAAPATKQTPAPEATPAPAAEPAAKPVLVARAEPPPPPPPEAPKATERNTYYAFTDVEIAKLKKRSRTFKKLHAQHQVCAKKTEKMIAKREHVREEIIELQNLSDRTSDEDDRLDSLRAEERRMKNDRGALATCEPLRRK